MRVTTATAFALWTKQNRIHGRAALWDCESWKWWKNKGCPEHAQHRSGFWIKGSLPWLKQNPLSLQRRYCKFNFVGKVTSDDWLNHSVCDMPIPGPLSTQHIYYPLDDKKPVHTEVRYISGHEYMSRSIHWGMWLIINFGFSWCTWCSRLLLFSLQL